MSKSKLDKVLDTIGKNYSAKKGSELLVENKISTGVFSLDAVLSGGISEGLGGHRIEFFGAESSCKTTFCLHIIKAYQKLGKTCIFIDGEHSYDPEWAEIIGVDNNNLAIFHPASLEEAGDLMVELIPEVDLIIIDSIVSLIPEAEIDRDTNEPTMGLQARVNSLITRKIYKTIGDYKTTMIFINQLREKIGIRYGNPYTTGGGRALKHLYHTRLEFKAGAHIEQGSGDKKEKIGREINILGVKNKKGVPYKKAICDFYFNGKVDNTKALFFQGIKYGVIELSGKTYSFEKTKVVGKDNFIKEFKNWDKIQEKLVEIMK